MWRNAFSARLDNNNDTKHYTLILERLEDFHYSSEYTSIKKFRWLIGWIWFSLSLSLSLSLFHLPWFKLEKFIPIKIHFN
jgi:hypothetical protein